MLGEPGDGDGAQPFRPAGQPDDVVIHRQFDDPVDADGQWSVIGCSAEERIPIARCGVEVGHAMTDIGDDPVDIDHGQRTGVLLTGDPGCRANHGQTVR